MQFARHSGFALLIIALLSLGAAGVHSVSHATLDLQTCDLCSTQGNPAFAIPPALALIAPRLFQLAPQRAATPVLLSADRPAWRSRAPPRAA